MRGNPRYAFGGVFRVIELVAERYLPALHAPILRVAGWDAPYPPFTSEEAAYRPDARRVALAIRRVLDF